MRQPLYRLGQTVLKVGTDHNKYEIVSIIFTIQDGREVVEYQTERNGSRYEERYLKPWTAERAAKQRREALTWEIRSLQMNIKQFSKSLAAMELELQKKRNEAGLKD